MRVLALVPSQPGHSPGQRSSIELWEPALKDAGVTLRYEPFETTELRRVLFQRGRMGTKALEMARAYRRRLALLRQLEECDAVYVYREAALIGPAVIERIVARKGKPIIYSLDDPLYVPYVSPVNGWLSYLKFFGKVATICRLSAVVIANSRFHRDYAARYSDNVRVIPSLVDGEKYSFRPREGAERVCIGWTGSHSTVQNLSLVADSLRELARRVSFRLHVVGVPRFEIPGVECTAQSWRAETEVEDLRQIDVGLAPLPDNEWNRRKFNLKIAQYMALGIVPVASPLGENPDVIEPGVDGFLAASPEEWLRHLEALVTDSTRRRSMAQRAARKAHESFTIGARASEVIGAFRSAHPQG